MAAFTRLLHGRFSTCHGAMPCHISRHVTCTCVIQRDVPVVCNDWETCGHCICDQAHGHPVLSVHSCLYPEGLIQNSTGSCAHEAWELDWGALMTAHNVLTGTGIHLAAFSAGADLQTHACCNMLGRNAHNSAQCASVYIATAAHRS